MKSLDCKELSAMGNCLGYVENLCLEILQKRLFQPTVSRIIQYNTYKNFKGFLYLKPFVSFLVVRNGYCVDLLYKFLKFNCVFFLVIFFLMCLICGNKCYFNYNPS